MKPMRNKTLKKYLVTEALHHHVGSITTVIKPSLHQAFKTIWPPNYTVIKAWNWISQHRKLSALLHEYLHLSKSISKDSIQLITKKK